MQNVDNNVAVLLVPKETKDRLSQITTPEMVFDKIGNKYFLSVHFEDASFLPTILK